MPEINETRLREQISKGLSGNLYFLYGDEKYLVKRDCKRLIKPYAAAAFPEFNYNTFPHTVSVDEIHDAVEALPFMAETKCVTVSDWNIDALNSTEFQKLQQLLENVPESTVLVFYYPTLEFDAKKSSKWKTTLSLIQNQGFSVFYAKRSESDLEKVLCREAERCGCVLSRPLAGRIVQYTGTDLHTLLNEIAKVCAFVESGEITKEHIEKLVTKNMETTVYLLSSALVRGDYSKAYTLLDLLKNQGESPIPILSVLGGAYTDMYRVRAALQSGKNGTAPMEYGEYKGREFRLRNAERDLRDLSVEVLRESMQLILECDLSLKLSSGDGMDWIALEKLFSKLLFAAHRGTVS